MDEPLHGRISHRFGALTREAGEAGRRIGVSAGRRYMRSVPALPSSMGGGETGRRIGVSVLYAKPPLAGQTEESELKICGLARDRDSSEGGQEI
jgi:hypothetical protein